MSSLSVGVAASKILQVLEAVLSRKLVMALWEETSAVNQPVPFLQGKCLSKGQLLSFTTRELVMLEEYLYSYKGGQGGVFGCVQH